MSPDQAREYLASVGYVPGVSSTSTAEHQPNREAIKEACRVLAEAERAQPALRHVRVAAPAAVKTPRRPEDVPDRGDRPGVDSTDPKPKRSRK